MHGAGTLAGDTGTACSATDHRGSGASAGVDTRARETTEACSVARTDVASVYRRGDRETLMSNKTRFAVAGGRIGRRTARGVADRGDDVVSVERGVTVDGGRGRTRRDLLHGDATAPSVQEQTPLERADAIPALTDEPDASLAVCAATERIAPDIRTLARTGTGTEDGDDGVADATILPQELSASAAADVPSRTRSLEGESRHLGPEPSADRTRRHRPRPREYSSSARSRTSSTRW